jgi:hypothetical protein
MTTPTAAAESLAIPAWPHDPLPEIRALGAGSMVIALDDDPTGTQTVRDVPVLTKWSMDGLRDLLDGTAPLAFLLTNSRSLSGDQAAELYAGHGRSSVAPTRRSGATIRPRSTRWQMPWASPTHGWCWRRSSATGDA